jgi:hypothetical protein
MGFRFGAGVIDMGGGSQADPPPVPGKGRSQEVQGRRFAAAPYGSNNQALVAVAGSGVAAFGMAILGKALPVLDKL